MNAAVMGLKQCPECGSERLTPLDGGNGLNFVCGDCASRWSLKKDQSGGTSPRVRQEPGVSDLEYPVIRH